MTYKGGDHYDNKTVPNTEGSFEGGYVNPDLDNPQAGNERGGEKGESEKGFTVVESVDITDRPIPNADPAGNGSWSYEQDSYFEHPDNDD